MIPTDSSDNLDPITVSLVDLFGCGFIAAIFLFLLYVGTQRVGTHMAGLSASEATQKARTQGRAHGPVFIQLEVPTGIGVYREGVWRRLLSEAQASPAQQRSMTIVVPPADRIAWPQSLQFNQAAPPPAGSAISLAVHAGPLQSAVTVDWAAMANQKNITIHIGRSIRLAASLSPDSHRTEVQVEDESAPPRWRQTLRFQHASTKPLAECTIRVMPPGRQVKISQLSATEQMSFPCAASGSGAEVTVKAGAKDAPSCTPLGAPVPDVIASAAGAAVKCR